MPLINSFSLVKALIFFKLSRKKIYICAAIFLSFMASSSGNFKEKMYKHPSKLT